MTSTFGRQNPIRYRGYEYDEESGLYYLRSRYYDPDTGRFISADSVMGRVGEVLSHNLYCYCGNNPVLYGDKSGYSFNNIFSVIYDENNIDITEKLESAMIEHYNDLLSYKNSNGYIAACVFFVEKVKTNGEWDLKSNSEWDIDRNKKYYYHDQEIRFDAIGNIHYGYVGAALFDLKTLKIAAGIYQVISKTSDSGYYKSCFDDPEDQQAIIMGYRTHDIGYQYYIPGINIP